MTELAKEAYGPTGDVKRHLSRAELDRRLAALPEVGRETGRLALISLRRPDGVRETPERVRLSLEEGVPGDGWSRRPPREADAQLAVIRHDIAELMANGQPVTMFGDNLYVDLDISAANLPEGTRLRVGKAIVSVSPKAHDGCMKLKERFGADALRFVQAPETRAQNRRGIYWKVVEPGSIAVGDRIEVLERA